jgi:hypothetical protein
MRTPGAAPRSGVMPPRLFPLFALALALAGCERPAAAVASPPPDAVAGSAPEKASAPSPAGTYAMQGDRRATLTLAPAGTGWRVSPEGRLQRGRRRRRGGRLRDPGRRAAERPDDRRKGRAVRGGRPVSQRPGPGRPPCQREGRRRSAQARSSAPTSRAAGSGRTCRAATPAPEPRRPQGAAAMQLGASDQRPPRRLSGRARLEIVEGYPWARFAVRQGRPLDRDPHLRRRERGTGGRSQQHSGHRRRGRVGTRSSPACGSPRWRRRHHDPSHRTQRGRRFLNLHPFDHGRASRGCAAGSRGDGHDHWRGPGRSPARRRSRRRSGSELVGARPEQHGPGGKTTCAPWRPRAARPWPAGCRPPRRSTRAASSGCCPTSPASCGPRPPTSRT